MRLEDAVHIVRDFAPVALTASDLRLKGASRLLVDRDKRETVEVNKKTKANFGHRGAGEE